MVHMIDYHLVRRNRDEVEVLRAAGHTVRSDEELVAAFAAQYGVTGSSARMALSGTCDDVVVGEPAV